MNEDIYNPFQTIKTDGKKRKIMLSVAVHTDKSKARAIDGFLFIYIKLQIYTELNTQNRLNTRIFAA